MTDRQQRSKLALGILVVMAAVGGVAGGILFTRHQSKPTAQPATVYYCPMHPDYRSNVPGDCPVCSMRLVPLVGQAGPPSSDMTPGGASTGAGITIPAEHLRLAGMRTAPVTRVDATALIRARGHVVPDETRIIHIHSRVAGFVEDVHAAYVGASVRRGETLFTILSPELVASQQELLSASRAAEALRTSTFEWAARDQLALVEAARQRLRLLGMSDGEIAAVERSGSVRRTIAVTSPVNGVVMERQAFAHGRSVTPDLDVYTIADLSVAWVLAQVYERDLAHVRTGQPAVVRSPDGTVVSGSVAFIAPFVDPATRTVSVRLDVPNDEGRLRTDSLVDVELREDLGPQLVVPEGALLEAGETTHAFVAREGRLEPRVVEAGPRVEQGRVVRSGLVEGEQVIASAQFVIDSESQLRGAIASWGEPASAASAEAHPTLTARIDSDPSPPRTGNAHVTVELTDTGGSLVEGAQVEMTLDMPAMGSMAPMRSAAHLDEVAPGSYAGTIEILMPFTWNVTVTAREDGAVLGVAHATLESR